MEDREVLWLLASGVGDMKEMGLAEPCTYCAKYVHVVSQLNDTPDGVVLVLDAVQMKGEDKKGGGIFRRGQPQSRVCSLQQRPRDPDR